MDQSGEIKIKTVPRTNEKPASARPPATSKPPRMIIYVVTSCVVALGWMMYPQWHKRTVSLNRVAKSSVPTARSGSKDLSSLEVHANESVSRYLQDAEIQREMMRRKRELENEQFKDAIHEASEEDTATLPEANSYGVQMDAEDSAEKVYHDLNADAGHYSENLPTDKINARLAHHKWVNELERRQQIEFVSNFIRSAYDRGYEVQLDQNLVVVGVRKINKTQVVNINQVIDRLAKQGL